MKTKLISTLIIITFSVGINTNVLASGPLFSQSFSNPLNLNPAYAGSLGHSRLAFAYRNQYPAIPGNNVFTSISYDHYFPKFYRRYKHKYISLIFFQLSINTAYIVEEGHSDQL